jgi:hypothetical protein
LGEGEKKKGTNEERKKEKGSPYKQVISAAVVSDAGVLHVNWLDRNNFCTSRY